MKKYKIVHKQSSVTEYWFYYAYRIFWGWFVSPIASNYEVNKETLINDLKSKPKLEKEVSYIEIP
jgi:hypothetical protein